MYEAFFGLDQRPFPFAPNSRLYFPAGPIESARQTLVRNIERAEGGGLIIGPTGAGKTLLCQMLGDHFQDDFHVANLASARLCTRRALLQNILFELQLPYRGLEEGELRLSLIDHLDPNHSSKNLLLLVDEAHTLPMRLLEEIRMITNLVRDGVPRVRLVLSGGPQLEERLANPKLDSLNQRITSRCYLQALTFEETKGFIRSQLEVSGGAPETIFTDHALQALHRASDGIPRLLNQVADHALMLAFTGGVKPIDAAGVEEAWADLQQLPTPWAHGDAVGEESSTVIEFGELDEAGGLLDESSEGEEITTGVFGALPDEPAEQVELRLAPDTWTDNDEAGSGEWNDERDTSIVQTNWVDPRDTDVAGPAPTVASTVAPTPHIVAETDPFAEQFDEEEVVIDRWAGSMGSLPVTSFVQSPPGSELDDLIRATSLSALSADQIEHAETEPAATIDVSKSFDTLVNETSVLEELTTGPNHCMIEVIDEVDVLIAAPQPLNADINDELSFDSPTGGPRKAETPRIVEADIDEPTIGPQVVAEGDRPDEPASDQPTHGDDFDMIIIDEDEQPDSAQGSDSEVDEIPAPRAVRREYRQLFAQLRRG